MPALSADAVQHYRTHGYVTPIEVMPEEEATALLDELLAIEAAQVAAGGGVWEARDYRPWERADHPLRAWAERIVRDDRVLDAVASVLGPDVFVKNPDPGQTIGWHLDTAETGPDTDGMLTAWFALTKATRRNGCLRFSSGTHARQIPHGPTDKHHLTLSREAVAHLQREDMVSNTLRPGQMSLHHIRLAHCSGPNLTPNRRIGFVMRFMNASVSPESAEAGTAVPMRGAQLGRFERRDVFPMTWTE